jgi:NhaA family Na+:H+ antiporter
MRKAAFPFIAALGGILVPVGLFFYLNDNPTAESGWGIPMATDIAFSLAILKLLGSRVPIGLKVFLTAFAIIDDLAAVLVIALFYSASIQWILIFISLGLLIILFVLSSFKFYSRYIFFIIGLVVWFLFLKSGVHPTIAGVLLAFAIPMRRGTGLGNFIGNTHDSIEEIKKAKAHKTAPETLLTYEQINALDYIVSETEKVQSPLQMLEHKLHGWVAFVILPLFAFANAGVTISGSAAIDFSLSLTIGLSLLAGKVVGVSLFSIAGVKFGLADLPRNTGYADIIGVGFLAGIGFTMSIFITNLAYASPELVSAAKVGILAGSFAAGILGYVVLRLFMRKAVK